MPNGRTSTEKQVRDGQFTREDGTKCEVELIYSSKNKYLEDENETGFIKYYKDRKYAFAALHSNEGVTVSEYIVSVDGEQPNNMLSNAQTCVVSTALSKIETEYKIEISNPLKEMSMPNTFNYTVADFLNMVHST